MSGRAPTRGRASRCIDKACASKLIRSKNNRGVVMAEGLLDGTLGDEEKKPLAERWR